MNYPNQPRAGVLIVHADAATGGGRATGLGVIVRDTTGRVLHIARRTLPAMTSNEAEYAAVVFGMESVRKRHPRDVYLFSDSRMVIQQILGEISVRSPTLKPWHRRAVDLARGFERITFTFIAREDNRLADALANEALAASPLYRPKANPQGRR